MSHRITVCTSCRLKGSDIRPGKALIHRLREAISATDNPPSADYEIGGAACLAGCKNSCTIAFQAKNKASYLFGDIEPDEDLGDIVDFAKDYALLADGWCSSVDRPGKLRTSTLARIPAFCGAGS